MSPHTDLVPSISPAVLLAHRDGLLHAAHDVLSAVQRLQQLSRQAGFGATDTLLQALARSSDPGSAEHGSRIVECFGQALDVRGWSFLMHASGLRSFMDRQARAEWDKQIKDQNTPELTASNIEATFQCLYDDRAAMVERGVIGVFRRLSWDHKTNLPALFGKKIVVKRFLDHHGFMSPDTGGLEDLVRAFCVFDGKPEPDHRAGLVREANTARGEAGVLSNNYLHVRWFKNGNAHATFKRPDLVDKLNHILAKHYPGALPAPR